jgi:DNA-binding MarR family transcriptional regulator
MSPRSAGRRDAAFPRGPRPWAAALYDDASFLFSRIGARADKLFARALEPLGLRPKHFAVLNYLEAREGASQRALVEGLWIDASTMVTLIDDFERLGLAERRPHPDDRRAYAVHLTGHGRRLLGEARRAAREVEEQILAPFDEEEIALLRGLLVRAAGGDGPEAPARRAEGI